jgi:hypothetical protein
LRKCVPVKRFFQATGVFEPQHISFALEMKLFDCLGTARPLSDERATEHVCALWLIKRLVNVFYAIAA